MPSLGHSVLLTVRGSVVGVGVGVEVGRAEVGETVGVIVN